MKKMVLFQLLSGLALSVFLLLWWDWHFVASFAVGGVLVVLNAWAMAKTFVSDGLSQKVIYRSAAVRYVGVFLALFAFALAGLNLLAICAGMFVAYLAGYVFSAYGAFESR